LPTSGLAVLPGIFADPAGVTDYNDIYFQKDAYNPGTPQKLGLLGHELVHVGQFRNGMSIPSYAFTFYWKEKPAYAMGQRIEDDLRKKGAKCCCQ
jgi:hypothetical protein